MKKILTILTFAAALITSVAQAQLVTNSFTATFTWPATGADGNVASFPYNGTAIDSLTVGNAEKVGVTSSSSNNNFRASNWAIDASAPGPFTLTGVVDLGKYFEFTLTAGAGATLNMTSITFGVGRSGTGPRQWEWRSSIDSYASILDNYTTLNANVTALGGVLTNPDANAGYTGNVLTVTGSPFEELSSVTFRIYAYNSETSAGTGGLQGPINFEGAMVVPEPSTYALLALAGAGLAGHLIRRRRR